MEMPPPLPKFPPGFWRYVLLGASANLTGFALNIYLCFTHLDGEHDIVLLLNCGAAAVSICACYVFIKNITFRLLDWTELRIARDLAHKFMRERENRK